MVLCLNLDTVKNKNLYQFDELRRLGYRFIVCGYQKEQISDTHDSYEYRVYPRPMLRRIVFLTRLIHSVRRDIHHVELYTGGGSFLSIDYLLSRLFGLKVCIVERGSPLRDLCVRYGFAGRWIRRTLYRRADSVWIRELWMKEALQRVGRADYFFLSNAIKVPLEHVHSPGKPIEFVWCNSLKSWRNSKWFIDALCDGDLVHTKAVIVGFLQDNATVNLQQEYALRKAREGVELLPFQQPMFYFLQSKFFVLPADIVYLNFSLLEAMAYGVVPIVSDVEGARDIVTDGESGFVMPHSRDGLLATMKLATRLNDADYQRMSRNARDRVIQTFSVESWATGLLELYAKLAAHEHPRS